MTVWTYFNTEIYHWALPEERHWKSIDFTEVTQQSFTAVSIGQDFTPTWSTHWFKVAILTISQVIIIY